MFKRILPHICIDTAVFFLVLWVLDRVNEAMHFLTGDVFKIPFVIVMLIVYQRRE